MSTSPSNPKVLVIGKDARSDAILDACARSAHQPKLFAFADSLIPGFVAKCERVFTGSLTDMDRLVQIVNEVEPALVIVGPEAPLAAGAVDKLEQLGIPAFGPVQQLAAIESSKSWARHLLDKYEIAGNPEYHVFETTDGLRDRLETMGSFVVKPDGLTGGKGVRVFGEHLHTIDEAFEYARSAVETDGRVEIEEKLDGQEFSLQTITDGTAWVHCPVVQDHKRAYEGDQGPNTGGMGSYSCPDFSLPFLTEDEVAFARSINEQVIRALAEETGRPYKGVLYGGFMATRNGVKLIEYNARFGDPEAMNVLPLLETDFIDLAFAVANGELGNTEVSFAAKATVCKYLVPEQYPDAVQGEPGVITVPADLGTNDDVRWFWAACRQQGDEVLLSESRSGAVVGIGNTLEAAEKLAEDAAASVRGPVRHRSDIGGTEAIQTRIEHMNRIRTGSVE
jgi:phosphoribosylamine---glycine ligase